MKKKIKIWIIGNGFDLAHDLKTSYQNFLDYTQEVLSDKEGNGLKKALIDNCELERFTDILKSNNWYHYFVDRYENKKLRGEDWINIEADIKEIIVKYEREYIKEDRIAIEPDSFFLNNAINNTTEDKFVIGSAAKDIIDDLYRHFVRFVWAFELYLVVFVNPKVIDKHIISDYEGIKKYKYNRDDGEFGFKVRINPKLFFNKILSFNYTSTANELGLFLMGNTIDVFKTAPKKSNQELRLYLEQKMAENVCYIHGKAFKQSCYGDEYYNCDNMVFGISETLSDDEIKALNPQEKARYDMFSVFKKKYQRTKLQQHKYIPSERYKTWISEMQKGGKHEINVIGHSLDETDHEILAEFFKLTDKKKYKGRIKLRVYYHNNGAGEKYIENSLNILNKINNWVQTENEPPTREELKKRYAELKEKYSVEFLRLEDNRSGVLWEKSELDKLFKDLEHGRYVQDVYAYNRSIVHGS
jgi:hypothetical protein